MSKKLILYNLDLSPPVRTVKIVAKLLGLDLELRNINLLEGEHLKAAYAKINPERVIPTLIDDGFVIWDSHAICTYLVDKYGKNDALYPKDLQLRARCNQRLFFDAASLFVRLRDCSYPIFFKAGKEVPQDRIDPIYMAYDILEAFLASDPFLVGKILTIADISVSVTLLPLGIYAPLQNEKHPKIIAWLKRVSQTIPFFDEVNLKYVEEVRQLIHSTLEKNKQQS
ncbi:glutathione S-transferase D7-like [Sitodiplosis mosellana]|uniref:glutathione S-transferase D7-like n=1 Tax=Sitodiplosis mosellana TaxID=263140 RepID=UPI002443E2D2|nr:glutathione S-transferase D7-like [Sitodiplosis mosellana]